MQKNPVLTAITKRRSTAKLMAPAPSQAVIKKMLYAAESAPDHGRLKPWRIHVVQGEALNTLGDVFADAIIALDSGDSRRIEKARAMPLRAPMIFVVCACISENKIPEIEQLVAAGVAVQNMQLVAHEAGFATIWRTGDLATDPIVKAAFHLRKIDHIVGFLYAGTADMPMIERTAADLDQGCVERAFQWIGPNEVVAFGVDG